MLTNVQLDVILKQNALRLKTRLCPCCMRVGINIVLGNKGVCKTCGALNNPNHFKDAGALPSWLFDDVPQYNVSPELECLSLAQKMLIQRASPFVPLRHIKNGIFGLAGHVVTFPQDVSKFVN